MSNLSGLMVPELSLAEVRAEIEGLAVDGQLHSAEAIASLMALLSYPHPGVPPLVVEKLIQWAPDSVEPLIAALTTTGDHGLQAYLIQALAQIGDERAIDLLIEVVGVEVANHCQGNVRRVAARGLGKMGRSTYKPEVLVRIRDRLIWALQSAEDWGLRYAAAVSLAEIGTPEAQVALQQAEEQEVDRVVRMRIQTALDAITPF